MLTRHKDVNLDDLTVVVRFSAENTLNACLALIKKEVSEENIFVIEEKPFSKAVKKTFEIGISRQKKWTLAIDADLLILPSSIKLMLKNAERESDKLYVYQGYILDWFKGGLKYGGPHLYQTKFLNEALQLTNKTENEIRPESSIYKLMAEKGKVNISDRRIYALHDFYQSSNDIYRKAYFHGIKHKGYINIVSDWLNKNKEDKIFKFCVLGFLDGYYSLDENYPSLKELENSYQNKFGDYILKNYLTDEIDFKQIFKEYSLKVKSNLKFK